MEALSQTCVHHPGRRGFALCMACRKVVCQECATQWKGVNYCRTCLAQRSEEKARPRIFTWAACALVAALAFVVAGRALAWTSGMILGPR
jgi:hypothetical protein